MGWDPGINGMGMDGICGMGMDGMGWDGWDQCDGMEMHGGFGALRAERTMNIGVRVDAKPPSPRLERDVARLAGLWGEGLSRFGGPWLAGGRFSAVDAFYAPVGFRVRTYGIDVGAAGAAWVETVLAHPAMLDWEAQALAETWREPGHEIELTECGGLTADYRAQG